MILTDFNLFSAVDSTVARNRETRDIRNQITLATMMSALSGGIDSHFYVNIDATTFEYEENTRGERVLVPRIRDKSLNVKKKQRRLYPCL